MSTLRLTYTTCACGWHSPVADPDTAREALRRHRLVCTSDPRSEAVELARLMLDDETWFANLADKDDLSGPNHLRNQAQRGLKLARLVASNDGSTP